MKITGIKAMPVKLTLHEPFITAALARTFHYTVLVKIETDEAIYGVGEASPARHVTGETVESVLSVIRGLEPILTGCDPFAVGKIHAAMNQFIYMNPSAKAGIDIALYDIQGKYLRVPLYKLLGGYSSQLETDVTLSVQSPAQLVAAAEGMVKKGFGILKIKTGLPLKASLQGIAGVRRAVGDGIVLKADANQSIPERAEAVRFIRALQKYDVIAIEQPCLRDDLLSMRYIRKKTGFPVIADESICTPADALQLIRYDACDGVNIKLMKSGGIYGALHINDICTAGHLPCMTGCMLESRVGITAAAHFAAGRQNGQEADLDACILTKALPFISGGFTLRGSTLSLSDLPGLGLEVAFPT